MSIMSLGGGLVHLQQTADLSEISFYLELHQWNGQCDRDIGGLVGWSGVG